MERFFRRPWLIVSFIGLITVFFAIQLPRAELDNNNLRFVPGDDPALLTSDRINDVFGSTFFVLVGLERKYGTVFDGPFLNRIKEYVSRIEEIDIAGNITSIISTDYITARGDAIVAEKLVPGGFSGTDSEVAALRERILSWDMYERTLVSDDFSATQILIPLEISAQEAGDPEVIASYVSMRDLAWEMFDGMAEVYVTGMPVICATINEAVNKDLALLVPLVVVVVLSTLFFSFRRLTAVVLPLLTVVISAIWSIGAMPLFGVKLSVISTVLPVILVAVGSAYGIHVITHYMDDRGARPMTREEHFGFVLGLLRKIGKPVFLAALTTFVGFVSFCFTRVLPIREFGYFSSFGVLAAFSVAVTLIPSLLLIRGPKPLGGRKGGKVPAEAGGGSNAVPGGNGEFDSLSAAIAGTFLSVVRKRRFILALTAIVLGVSLYGLSKIVIDNIMVEYFREETDIYVSDAFIREKFGGSKVVNLVVEADDSETLLHPDTLRAVDGLGAYLVKNVAETGKVMGFTDLVKRINQVFNADESPEGLAPSAFAEGGEEDFGFGGEDAFGFGGEDTFGFSDGDGFGPAFAEEGYSGGGASAARGAEDRDSAAYTGKELFALLDSAAGTGRHIDANALVWELKRLVNYDGAAYYEIPADPARYGKKTKEELQRLVSNYLVLLSGNIGEYANDPLEPTAIRSVVQLRTVGQGDTDVALDAMRGYIAANFPPGVRTTLGGVSMVEASLNTLVVQSQLISVFVSLFLVFIIVTASNRSCVMGLIGIIPLTITILINFAVMGFAGIKLNIGTSMVASVSIGIGIDYTIHYIEAFKREYRLHGEEGGFLRRTFATSGKAILINAVSVGAGFAVLMLSRFNMLGDLGGLITLTMGTSALVSLTVIPVLLTALSKDFIRKIILGRKEKI
ncbi:MAG: MMPL family transporter [Treponema sp.]|jgi:predicted RND superfamily exporter protein|nr:MMPL family transporter [Treponema sp.]